jgi:two-component system LytT family response regulator
MIRCAIIDDSPLAVDLLTDYIQKVDFLRLEHTFTNAVESLVFLERGNVDLLFLDIQMPEISGIELMKKLNKKTKVIFTTAFSKYAVDGFNLNAVDYLLKPFSFERFLEAVNKVKTQMESEKILFSASKDDAFIFVKSGYESIKVYFKDILYIEALKDYVQIFTTEKKILALLSMKNFLAELPQDNFIRVHRSYIVSLSKITKVSTTKIEVGLKVIPLGNLFRSSFLEKMSKIKSG